jgi:hypothetical protein
LSNFEFFKVVEGRKEGGKRGWRSGAREGGKEKEIFFFPPFIFADFSLRR